MNKILLVFVAILILNLVACSKPAPEETHSTSEDNVVAVDEPVEVIPPVESGVFLSLSDFKNLQFFQQNNCAEAGSWVLQNGNTNYTYDVGPHSLEVEIEPGSQKVVGFGLMFFDRRTLSESDIAIITDLITSLDQSSNHDDTISFVRANIENSVSQIRQAESVDDGNFRIWAGKVGAEQVVSFERIG